MVEPRMSRKPNDFLLRWALAVVLLGALMSGCGGGEPTNPTTTTAATLTTPQEQTDMSTQPPGTGTPGETVTLSGTLQSGVESGCVVLVDAEGAVLANLVDLDVSGAQIGADVEVTGSFNPDLMTTCQQGQPFEVTDFRVL